MAGFSSEFREFVSRGNVVDMAVGIVIGSAFGRIAQSLVDNVIMPPIGLLLGGVEFEDLFIVLKEGARPEPYITVADAQAAGAVTVNYGLFVNTVVTFFIVALAVFLLVRGINRLRRRKEEAPASAPTSKECNFCFSTIPVKATRCPSCTSTLATQGVAGPGR
ncbi:MAG: large-conductance mechanosensitive channel protein MscL [Proteobacteria bacterium]|nr:large-conductance mechanosensitive channel protein MscL [Pseudomonadota bacterium]